MFSSPFLLSLLLLLSPTPTLSSSLEWEVPTFTLLQPQHNTTVINLSELTIQWTVNSTLPPSTAVTVELWEARNIQNHPFLGPNKLTDDLVATIETGYKNCPGEETCIINWRIPAFVGLGDAYYVKIYSASDFSQYAYGPTVDGSPTAVSLFSIVAPASNLWWLFGVFLSIIASIASNMGVNLQKLSMMNESKLRAASEKRSYVSQPLWLIGLASVIGGSIGDFAALGFAPQSLMTPVGGFTLVCNAGFAHYFLGERMSLKDKAGTFGIIIGIIVLAYFSPKSSTSYTLEQLLEMYITPPFLTYVGAFFVLVSGFYFVYLKATKIKLEFGVRHPKYLPYQKLHPLSCSALSGTIGAQSILCAKSVAEMIKESFDGNNQFVKPLTWVIVLFMVIFIFSQIHWLARGLESFDAVYIVPVFQCFFISVAVVGGAVYFREFDEMTATNRFMFFVGLGILLVGVYLLSQRDMSKLKPKSRFRARVDVVLFLIRTQRVVREKSARRAEEEKQILALDKAEEQQKRVGSLENVPSLPGGVGNSPVAVSHEDASPKSRELLEESNEDVISPRERRERRSQEEDAEKQKLVTQVRESLRFRPSVKATLPIMEMTLSVDKRKKKVEETVASGLSATGEAITAKRRRSVVPFGSVPVSKSAETSPRDNQLLDNAPHGVDIRLSEGSDQSPMKSEPDLESGQKEKDGDAV